MKAPVRCSRSGLAPSLFVEKLATDIAGFAQETVQTQAAIGCMVWASTSSYRDHSHFEGFMSFHYLELSALFNGQFDVLNKRLCICEVTANWRFGSMHVTGEGFTKGYRLSVQYQNCLDAFLRTRQLRTTRLLGSSGRMCGTLPRPIQSHDMAGVSTDRWGAAHKAQHLARVPVSVASLTLLWLASGQIMVGLKEGKRLPEYAMNARQLAFLRPLRQSVEKLIVLAHTDVAGHGYVMHQYSESPSGRLYCLGGANLQNAPRLVRKTALSGCWDYDIQNCHFSIAAQLARQAGLVCPVIENYMQNKAQVRNKIAQDAGISIDQTKKCLLACMYGARRSLHPEKHAIPTEIGAAAARRLYASPHFSEIADEIENARAVILKAAKLNRQGGLKNAFGKTIGTAGVKATRLMSHLILGVEAMALRACLDHEPESIVLLQHDGFTSTKRLDVHALQRAIFVATKFQLILEEEQIGSQISSLRRMVDDLSFPKYEVADCSI
jgi:hypothetical protein